MQTSEMVTLHDLLNPILRYRWVAFATFCCVFAAAALAATLLKPEYEATMKVLVKKGRMDPIMTPTAVAPSQAGPDVTEDELNSEVELLKSRDLLEQVAIESGLATATGSDGLQASSERAQVARAVAGLQRKLKIEAIRKTTLISVDYRSTDPDLAARVLSNLAKGYVEKHLAVHRPTGAYQFFMEQTEAFGRELQNAEARLSEFGRTVQVISPATERDSALQTLAEFEASLQRTRAAIAEANQRLSTLDREIADIPSRQTTEIRTAEDGERIRELKLKLLDLELKQGDMLKKFTPEYPPLQQLHEQIGQVRVALANAEITPVTAETTNQNPTHQWLRDERARVTTERDALDARAQALSGAIGDYRAKARRLDEARTQQGTLVRAVNTAQETYQLYQRKQEEARISDALDRTRIANVSLAEEPTAPSLPSNSRRVVVLLLGLIAGMAAAVGVAVVLHYLNPFFRTADEVSAFLGVPVLATIPAGVK